MKKNKSDSRIYFVSLTKINTKPQQYLLPTFYIYLCPKHCFTMSLPINISDLVNGQSVEWDRIEFKEGWNPEAVLHTITAFANDINNWGGGYIIVGISEKEGVAVLPPVGLQQAQIDKIQKELINLCHLITPNYFPITQPYLIEGKHVFIIWIPGGDNRPYKAPATLGTKSEKIIYIRRGANTVKANTDEERLILDMAKRIPFDDRVNHHASIEDFNKGIIKDFLKAVKSDLYKYIDKIAITDLVRQMYIATGPDEYLLPLNVGLLFFTPNPELLFKGAKTEVVTYKNGGEDFAEKMFVGPLHEQIKNVLNHLMSVVITKKVIKQKGIAEALHIYNYPFEAVEEAVVNAFYHRSYELDNPIEINIWEDKIEILSYPGPLPPVTNAMLKQKRIIARDYRNRRIGDFLKELRLTEGRGTGIPVIYNSLKSNGSPAPIFETDENHNYFLCTLPIHEVFLERNTKLDATTLKILDFCISPQSSSGILKHIGFVNHSTNHKKYIMHLMSEGWLLSTSPDKPTNPKQKYYTTDKGKEYLLRQSLDTKLETKLVSKPDAP